LLVGSGITFEVDPRTLRLPPARASGADPAKLQRQIAAFGRSVTGMPHLLVYRASDGELVIYDGVTRATRVARLTRRSTVTVEIVGDLPVLANRLPMVEERLP